MKKLVYQSSIILGALLFITSCKENKKEEVKNDHSELTHQLPHEKTEIIDEPVKITHTTHFMTKEAQEKTNPDMIINELEAGNERFRTGKYTARDHSKAIVQAIDGQYPKAFILSCIDSRVPVEDVFDQGIGDLFVGRVAGNVADKDMLGSMEYACKVAGSKVIVVLGHQSCGAIKGAIDIKKIDDSMSNLKNLLEQLRPAIAMSSTTGEKTAKNHDYVHEISINNVKNTIKNIREKSPVLREMEEKGQIKIVGAFYSLKEGQMEYIKK